MASPCYQLSWPDQPLLLRRLEPECSADQGRLPADDLRVSQPFRWAATGHSLGRALIQGQPGSLLQLGVPALMGGGGAGPYLQKGMQETGSLGQFFRDAPRDSQDQGLPRRWRYLVT